MVHGPSLATITGMRLGNTPFVQVSTTWALTCPETVHHRPCTVREIETYLSDSRAGCRILGSVTTVCLTTEAVDQSSLRWVTVSTEAVLKWSCVVEGGWRGDRCRWGRLRELLKKVKFSHTRYRALGLELIPVYRQSARRWREVNHAIYPAVVCRCFLPGLRLPS